MDDEAFWGLLDRRGTHEDCDALAAALQTELETRPVEEIADFCHTFDACMDALYTWELWAAAYIMSGGCSDDGFEYFRCWVIAQGREAFEVARTDPERFGLSIDPGTEDLERAYEGDNIDDIAPNRCRRSDAGRTDTVR